MSQFWGRDDDPVDVARRWHWAGEDVTVHRVELDDEDVPDPVIACGRFCRIELSTPRGPQRIDCDDPHAWLAFDPASAYGRLYLVLPPEVLAVTATWWRPRGEVWALEELAEEVGGRQQGGYPDVEVQLLGTIEQVEYFAKKYARGADKGATFYHRHDRRPRPRLGVDALGRLWYAGGDYDGSDPRGIVG